MQCVFEGTISLQNLNYSLKKYTMPFAGECRVHFHMSNLLFKGAESLLEKLIFLHNMQYYLHIEHPSQKCHMFEHV